MKEPKEQIQDWLKKLEQESWQLELLVSAFTIFLLFQAISSFSGFLEEMQYQYNLNNSLISFIFIFMGLVSLSVKALAVFMILHLLLRGFWIGAIGLRSVQSEISFERLNYSRFFAEKIKKKVISLDNLVIMLDEICSLIFSTAFLFISMILSFGLYLILLGVLGFGLGSLVVIEGMFTVVLVIITVIMFLVVITGIIYFLDYFTLGFFKKFQWLSKIYYPIYRFYGAVTFAAISRSIYYYLISKFSKRRIRYVYLGIVVVFLLNLLISYDQYQFYPSLEDATMVTANTYDNKRGDKYIEKASIQNNVISDGFVELFIRYNPQDNSYIRSNCPGFEPAKNEGLNWRFKIISTEYQFYIQPQDYSEEDRHQLLKCLSETYLVSINDSLYTGKDFFFFSHPGKDQKGIVTLISTEGLPKGSNILSIDKSRLSSDGERVNEDYAVIPFWIR